MTRRATEPVVICMRSSRLGAGRRPLASSTARRELREVSLLLHPERRPGGRGAGWRLPGSASAGADGDRGGS